jgi:hypothetical protein
MLRQTIRRHQRHAIAARRKDFVAAVDVRLRLTSSAILAGALLIAAAIVLTSHWSIVSTQQRVGVVRLDRWTGRVVLCEFKTALAPAELDCAADDWQPVGANH